MDRGFSVDEMSDQFWSSPARPAATLTSSSSCRSEQDESSTKMNRSESEWAFHRYLQEASSVPAASGGDESDVVEIKGSRPDRGRDQKPIGEQPPNPNSVNKNASKVNTSPPSSAPYVNNNVPPPPLFNGVVPPTNSEEYQAFLKSKLNLACAAVALSRASFVINQDPGTPVDNSQASKASHLGSQALSEDAGISVRRNLQYAMERQHAL